MRPLILERTELRAKSKNHLATERFIAQYSWFKTISECTQPSAVYADLLCLLACGVSIAPSLPTSPGMLESLAKICIPPWGRPVYKKKLKVNFQSDAWLQKICFPRYYPESRASPSLLLLLCSLAHVCPSRGPHELALGGIWNTRDMPTREFLI